MLKNKFISPSNICLIIISVSAILFSIHGGLTDMNGNNRNTISSDGLGYYNYLPSIFIHDDFSDKFENSTFILPLNDSTAYNKYFSGTAVLISPFFAAGHLSAYLFGYEQNGFSIPYQTSVAFAGLFYLFLGLHFLRKLLKSYNFSEFSISATLLLLFFGTNLLSYSTLSPSMSHVYSFSLISVGLYLARSYWVSNESKTKNLIAFSIVLALIVLIRPINGCVLFLFPFLSNNYIQWKNEWKSILGDRSTYFSAIIFIAILFVQPYLWYLQTGQWFIWSYAGEGFNFSEPRITDVLFSFRKGWWIYTPLMIISTIGLFFWFKKNVFLAIGLSFFVLFFIYITSSWWNWYYGSSFGQRPFIDIYGIMALGLAVLLDHFTNWKKYVLLSLGVIFSALNLVQTYQYENQILSPDFMTKEKYEFVFLETDESFKDIFGGYSDIEPFNAELKSVYHHKVENFDCKNVEYCGIPKKNIDTYESQGLWLEVNVKWETFEKLSPDSVLLVVQLANQEKSISYFTAGLTPVPRNKANLVEDENYTFHFKEYREDNCDVSIFIWNRSLSDFKINSIDAEISTINFND
ncbi:hypothetical protein [Brumimicrobium mesophilum]|uniref:hypothetical protein n=1 Tax=Brumimicrobium mesophilum TaxID=392717 RepID=UPI00131B841F|nr:hypothetical protein [Brumimicrobium mesophilum]